MQENNVTNYEAIDVLDTLIGMIDIRPEVCNRVDEALKIGIKAIKKQIPMKPNIDETAFTIPGMVNYECPMCLDNVGRNQRYCDNCAQALDWYDYGGIEV